MKPAILLLILSGCAVARGAAPATTQAVSGTRYAHREFRIVARSFEPAWDDVDALIERRSRELAPQIIHRPADNIGDWFRFERTSSGGGKGDYQMGVSLADDAPGAPAAKEMLDAIVASVQDFVAHDFERQRDEQIRPRQDARGEAEARLSAAEKEAQQLRAKMRDLAGRGDISGKTITDAMTRLEEEKQTLELDTMAKTARREALEQEIAQQSDRIQKKIADDAIAAELQKVVDARQQAMELAKKQQSAGVVTDKEASDAVAALADARAKLLERKRDAAAEAGGDALTALNRELLNLSIDLRELKARLGFVQERLPGLRDAMDLLDAWQQAENDLSNARQELDNATMHLRDTSRELSVSKPTQVIVTKSEDRPRRTEATPLFQDAPGGLFGGEHREAH